ncbi:MFS transporter [Arthrobacter sp. zg-Y1219]|uniref:MFS transporter n=1 Tax=Arthrobacter sp. zg-Y1219 TaxID=3049067 RepID=UPI0024C29CFB|nr:MFS transporter [Arthrobacter sp. zg-Y1219]MDK1358998.1 MFS transporter [Arthrobacter sp. zg-Y1219]
MRIGSKETKGWKATISVAMSNYIEAGSIIAIASSLSLWQEYLGIDNYLTGLLAALSANAFGAAIGGPLCDRFGRKFIYTYDLMLYMAGVLLAAFAGNFWMLLAAFVMTGIAVGAGVPASWTYIAEEAPADKRAAHVGMAQLAWSLGPVIGFALAILVGPLGLLGSRLIFLHLFVVAFVTWYIRQGLKESVMWTEEKAQAKRNEDSGRRSRLKYSELFTNRTNLKALLFLFGVYAFWNTVAGAMGIFMPRIYEAVGGLNGVQANLLQVVLWSFTVLATYFGFMRLADRYSRRLLYGIGAALGIIAWVLLVFAPPIPLVLGAFVVLWGISAGIGAQAFYGLWASELFATRYRAGAQGILFFAARTTTGLLSFFFPTMLATVGFVPLGLTLIVLLVVAAIVGVLYSPDTQGKSLQEIEVERYGAIVDDSDAAGDAADAAAGPVRVTT